MNEFHQYDHQKYKIKDTKYKKTNKTQNLNELSEEPVDEVEQYDHVRVPHAGSRKLPFES